jgi:hypothetical protein
VSARSHSYHDWRASSLVRIAGAILATVASRHLWHVNRLEMLMFFTASLRLFSKQAIGLVQGPF